ncbi:portal protein [Ralstonia phage Hyacinthe]|uniref:Portal protein n=3 Tax=Rahariannevirus raharianne TaxID=2846050 RepID=A0A7G5BBC1_9CAUD|nr:portal protein [Ralstonia phage Raharianne]QMV32400.1 portal protein [Ralstonia phage Albius]QMV33438.1 portal protein [Ralstonia phage Hyacinthe]QMV33594.1 portal protein [Ralstonia phage Raharianne]
MSDFKTIKATFKSDSDYPERTARLLALSRVLDGTLYDDLQHAFDDEQSNGEYVPLKERRPSARTRICATVVSDSVSLLFSEGHFPAVECKDEATRDALTKITKETNLNAVMIDAATRGSVGSVAILLRVLRGRVFFAVLPTAYMTPEWEKEAPDTLKSVTERYKVRGSVLKASGYAIADGDLNSDFWFQRVWDGSAETWYLPQSLDDVKEEKPPVVDSARTTQHNLGFVPMVWVKNLPGGDDIDGAPTFPPEAIDLQIEADYLLSQGGRGLKYQSDPTLLIKEPALGEKGAPVVKGAANAIVTSNEGDAKLLEISGDAATAVMDWVRGLRDIALEGAGGNRSNPDKLSAAQSGRAMELMNQGLIWSADRLRISYGEGALLSILEMIVRASAKFPLKDKKGREIGALNQKEDISLRWPQWYAPTYADKQTQAMTLDVLRGAGLLSQETAVKSLASGYDIPDPADEIRKIDAEPPPPNSPAAKPKQEPLSQSDD